MLLYIKQKKPTNSTMSFTLYFARFQLRLPENNSAQQVDVAPV